MPGPEEAGLLYEDMRQKIAAGKAVAIVGAGISMAATKGAFPAAAWRGLLDDGLKRCGEVGVPGPNRQTTALVAREIKTGQVDMLTSAADKISKWLQSPGGEFSSWLRNTVGALEVQDPEVIQAINDLKIPIVTTNYDDLIEDVAKLPAITWLQKPKVQRWLRGEESGVLHIHGHWEVPESVVLGTRSYENIRRNDFAQEIMRTLRMTKTFVFIGFGAGLEDPNFSMLVEWARELLSDSEYRLYRLVLQNDLADAIESSIPADRLYPVSYGQEYAALAGNLRGLAPQGLIEDRASGVSATTLERPDPKFPGCVVKMHSVSAGNFRDLIQSFERHFQFRWERGSFQYGGETPVVYWPVRLRQPTPIHAVQCFSASALQQRGAEVYLCLDDLGNKDYPVPRFFEVIERWFAKAGGDSGALKKLSFSEMVEGDNSGNAWPCVRMWLGDTRYFLDKVLSVSKLVPSDDDNPITIEELGNRRPRRLLTPAVVWACLSYVHQQTPDRSILTLSGYDERALWQAWRECTDTGPPTGHLYIPELIQPSRVRGEQAVHMESTPLGWESREDITNSLTGHLSSRGGIEDCKSQGRIIPWCMTGCVSLPEFVAGGLAEITTYEIRPEVDSGALVASLVDALESWLLSHE